MSGRRVRPTARLAPVLVAALLLFLPSCGGSSGPASSITTSFAGGATSTTAEPSTTVTTSTTQGSPGSTPVPSAVLLTPSGFGPLTLGMSEAAAEDTGFIGEIAEGCPASAARSAPLRPPLAAGNITGFVEFHAGTLDSIHINDGGTTEEGVAAGDSLPSLLATYAEGATVDLDRSTEDMFGIWVARVVRDDGGTYGMVIDPATEEVTSLSVPGVRFCE